MAEEDTVEISVRVPRALAEALELAAVTAGAPRDELVAFALEILLDSSSGPVDQDAFDALMNEIDERLADTAKRTDALLRRMSADTQEAEPRPDRPHPTEET